MTNDVMITMIVGMTAEMTTGMTVAMIIGMITGKFYTSIRGYSVVTARSSGILKAKQKLGVTFNSNKLEVRFYMNGPSKLHAAISSKQFLGLELLY